MRKVSELLDEIGRDHSGRMSDSHSFKGLTRGQIDQLSERDMPTYTGKVRDVVRRGDELYVVHSDRLTAFDKMIAMVPYKGTILTAISEYWLAKAKEVVPTHLIGRPQERVLKVQRTTPFKVEVIVRGFLAGSMQRAYDKGERLFCGVDLPEGLKAFGPLPAPIITPTTKAAAYEHDENITAKELVARGIATANEWQSISTMALKLFAHGQAVFSKAGFILVDTKYEFGKTKDGAVIVIDEIHTPDSSRLWEKDSYATRLAKGEAPQMLDKETVRRWLIDKGFSGEGPVPTVPVERLVELAKVYLSVAERLTGSPLLTKGPGGPVPSDLAL